MLIAALLSFSLFADNQFHQYVEKSDLNLEGKQWIQPTKYQTVLFDFEAIKTVLDKAPMEFTNKGESNELIIAFPSPEGKTIHFSITESKMMEDELAVKFPQFKTFNGQGIEDKTAILKLDYTHKGLHAYVLSSSGDWAIDPLTDQTTSYYQVYAKKDFQSDKTMQFSCGVEANDEEMKKSIEAVKNSFDNFAAKSLPQCILRTYRIGINATGEYTAFHGGTVADGMAAIMTTMNRVNGVYERDAALRMILIGNNDLVVYTNASTDPFNNNNASALLNASHTNLVSVIGSANFDIGHVFATGGSGLASLNGPCNNGNKGAATTGINPPTGDFFDIDYVSHELGHQWGGNHTWDYCGGAGSPAAARMEPGSAATIMGYAGLCGANNIQNNSDAMFHSYSIQEMTNYSQLSNGNNCAQSVTTGNNAPVADAGANYTIPKETPFQLTGSATDPDNDGLTYSWEGFEAGSGTPVASPTNSSVLFRAWLPTVDNFRIFPRLAELLNNTTPFGETLPFGTRNMPFRLTVRDNAAGGGCTDFDDMIVSVNGNAGPFLVQYPNGGEVINALASENIQWDVAGTDAAPVSCANVDILLSTDGGQTFPTVLASNVPNDGAQVVTFPNMQSTTARIKIVCSDNIFFDLSNANFQIDQASQPSFSFQALADDSFVACSGNDLTFTFEVDQILGFNDPISYSITTLPAGSQASFSPNNSPAPATITVTISNTSAVPSGLYNLNIEGTTTSGVSDDFNFTIEFSAGTPNQVVQISPTNGETGVNGGDALTWNISSNATLGYEIEIASDATFNNIIETASTINANYNPTTATASNTTYFWRVRSLNGCGDSGWSQVFSFTTSNCFSDQNTTSVSISASGTPTITSTINVGFNGIITDVKLNNLTGTHTWISDLGFTLTSPAGTTITLLSQVCNNEDDFDLNFSDAGLSNNSIPCPPTDGGNYQPINGSFSNFVGESSMGVWTLTVTDIANQDGGSLNSWDLDICTEITNMAPNVMASPTQTSICQGEQVTLNASGAASYIWTPSASLTSSTGSTVIATPTATTTYTVTGMGVNGLTNTAQVTVTVNNNPVVSIFGLPSNTVSSAPIMLNATPAGGTFSGAGVLFNAFNPSISGPGIFNITYSYIDADGCEGSDSDNILVGTIVYNFVNYNLGTILPMRELSVSVNVLRAGQQNIRVFNANGIPVYNGSKNFASGENKFKIDMPDLPKGIYFIQIGENDLNGIKKFYKF